MSEKPRRSVHSKLQEQSDFLSAFHFAYTQEYVVMLLQQIKLRDVYINDLEHTLLSCRTHLKDIGGPYSEQLCERIVQLLELDEK